MTRHLESRSRGGPTARSRSWGAPSQSSARCSRWGRRQGPCPPPAPSRRAASRGSACAPTRCTGKTSPTHHQGPVMDDAGKVMAGKLWSNCGAPSAVASRSPQTFELVARGRAAYHSEELAFRRRGERPRVVRKPGDEPRMARCAAGVRRGGGHAPCISLVSVRAAWKGMQQPACQARAQPNKARRARAHRPPAAEGAGTAANRGGQSTFDHGRAHECSLPCGFLYPHILRW